MALTAPQIPLLVNATAVAAQQAANADAARLASVAANGPPPTAQAPALARASEAAADAAQAASTSLRAQVAVSNMDAVSAADSVVRQQAAEQVLAQKKADLTAARGRIRDLEHREQELRDLAVTEQAAAAGKGPPVAMLDREARLALEAQAKSAAREAAKNALALAQQHLLQVVANTPVQTCPFYRPAFVFGAFVPPKPAAVEQAEAEAARKKADYDAVAKGSQEENEYQKQLLKVEKFRAEQQRFLDLAKERLVEADRVARQNQDAKNALPGLQVIIDTAQARVDSAIVERNALEAIPSSGAAAANCLARARASYLTLGMADELADRDMKSGAAIDAANLLPVSRASLIAFNATPPTTGQTAKVLAGVLAAKTQADFIPYMNAQAALGLCTRTQAGPMLKYEYPDGTEVRHKTVDNVRPPPSYSIEVKHTPAVPDAGPADVAFKVDRQGRATPKNPQDTQNPFPVDPQRLAYEDRCMGACHFSIPA